MTADIRAARGGVVRVTQKPLPEEDKRAGGGVRKMFYDARRRLEMVAAEYPAALQDFTRVYAREEQPQPYLVAELLPTAIAKSHSAKGVLENYNVSIVGGRDIHERILHGQRHYCDRLTAVLALAAELAPTDEQLLTWDSQEKKNREQAKRDKKSMKRVRRTLMSSEMTWGDVAQLSTIAHIRNLTPEDKILARTEAMNSCRQVLVSTFAYKAEWGDDLHRWLAEFDRYAHELQVKKIRALWTPSAANEQFAHFLGKSGKKGLWQGANAQPRGNSHALHRSFFFLVEGNQPELLWELSKLSFVQTLEPLHVAHAQGNRTKKFTVPPSPRALSDLPLVGVVDTGIMAGSPLDGYILHRRGDDAIRQQGESHATEVAQLLVADATATPWQPGLGEPCAIIDVAAINGATTEAGLQRAIEQGTADVNGIGVVNLSANSPREKQSRPASHISGFGALLDGMCLEEDGLLIVNSSGNSGSIGMDPPADAVHVLTVGAVTRRGDGKHVPAGYSCRGGGVAHNVKPTLVAPVGDDAYPCPEWTTRGVFGGLGTSLAAPLAARVAANLMKRGCSRDEALALMVHAANTPGGEANHQPTIAELEQFGFGIVPSVAACDPPDRDRFTMLYECGAKKGVRQVLKLPIPEALHGHAAFFRLTAYVKSPVNFDEGSSYIAADATIKARLYRASHYTTRFIDVPEEPDDVATRYEQHRIRYGWKWNVLRRYSRKIEFADFSGLELRIGPVTWRDWAEERDTDSEVKVQCVLSFLPLSPDAPGFFDPFMRALAQQEIQVEALAARLEAGIEI